MLFRAIIIPVMLLDEFCQDWNLLDPVLLNDREDTEFYRVEAPDGPACLQIFKNGLLQQSTAIGIAYKAYKGKCAPELYMAGPRAVLIALAQGQKLTALIREGRAPAAMDAASRLVAGTIKTAAPPAYEVYLTPLERHLKGLLEETLPDALTGMDIAAQAYIQGLTHKTMCHGNLTPETLVYHDKTSSWIGREPFGILADGAFEAGGFYAAFLAEMPVLDKARALELLAILIDKTGVDKDRLLAASLLAAGVSHLKARRKAGEDIPPHAVLSFLKTLGEAA